ncbi:putative peptidyl-prolyl cis-trans isomerase [Anaerolineae bacterium]|nr:putative peptidyl-prolyl cis-trans isomerase [Anaerolineae bacterium]
MLRDPIHEDCVNRTLIAVGFAALLTACASLSTTNAQEQPKPPEPKTETPKLPPVPSGEKSAEGLKFAMPFKRGEGSVVFSRQNGYLRVDADIRLPYNAGDAQKSVGSGVALVLSEDGVNGRIFVNHPSPLWFFQPSMPPFRLEKSFAKTGEPAPIAAQPSFGAQSNLNFLDRWTTTFWVNLPRVIIAGNTPDYPADAWRAAFTTGDEAAHEMLPTGVNLTNPALTPERMLTFRVSELPERAKLADDPIEAVNKREEAIGRELIAISNTLSLPRNASEADVTAAFVKGFNAVRNMCKTWPDLLLSRFMSWQFAIRMGKRIEADPIALLKEYLDACPSQWQVQTNYLDALLKSGRKEEALKRIQELLGSGLGKGFPPAEVRLKLDLAPLLVDCGEAEAAMKLYETVLESDVLKTDNLMRLRAAVGSSRAASRLGKAELEQKFMDLPQAEPALGPVEARPLLDYMRMLFKLGYEDEGMRAARILSRSKWLAGNAAVQAQAQLDGAEMMLSTNYGAADAKLAYEAALNSGALKENDMARFGCWVGLARCYEAQGDMVGAADTYTKLLTAEKGKLTSQQEQAIKQLMEFQTKGQSQWTEELKYREEDAKKKNPTITIETTKGTIVVELFEDDAPTTVNSIVSLIQKKFYDGLGFHRYEPNFVIQGGDPNGDGTGGPGYALKSEVSRRNHFMGTFAMACSRPKGNTEGSQFYICTSNGPNVLNLSGNYVVAGRVVKGMEIALRLRSGDRMTKVTVENLRDHEYKPETLPAPK